MNNNFLFRLGSGNCIFTCLIVHYYLRQLKWVDKVYFAKFWIWTETMLSFCSSFCSVQFLVYSLDFSVTISLFWFSIDCFWSGLVQEQIKCGPITTSVYYDDFCQQYYLDVARHVGCTIVKLKSNVAFNVQTIKEKQQTSPISSKPVFPRKGFWRLTYEQRIWLK